MPANETIRVHIPLTVRKHGRRPRILPQKDIETLVSPPGQDPRVLRAISRAWAWRKRMVRGELTTIADLAAEERLSDRYVSRLLRLAWLAPDVLEQLVVHREPCAFSLYDLCFIASLPWDEQPARVFD